VRSLAITAFLVIIALAPIQAQTRYVGLRHPPLPSGIEVVSASMMIPYDTIHAIALVNGSPTTMVWLERAVCGSKKCTRDFIFEVRAVLVPPSLNVGQSLMLETCALGSLDHGGDSRLVAIATFVGDSLVTTRIDRAWRVDLTRERFEPIPAKGVICFKESGPEEED
jgi:hypothetical protein